MILQMENSRKSDYQQAKVAAIEIVSVEMK
jgi:hypothetical protein